MAEVSARCLVPQSGVCRNHPIAHTAARVCLHAQERGGSSLTQQQLPVAPQEKFRVAFFPDLASAAVVVQDGNASRAVGW